MILSGCHRLAANCLDGAAAVAAAAAAEIIEADDDNEEGGKQQARSSLAHNARLDWPSVGLFCARLWRALRD